MAYFVQIRDSDGLVEAIVESATTPPDKTGYTQQEHETRPAVDGYTWNGSQFNPPA